MRPGGANASFGDGGCGVHDDPMRLRLRRSRLAAALPDAFAGTWRSVTPSFLFVRLSVSSTSSETCGVVARLTFSGVAWEGSGRITGDSLVLRMSNAGSAVPTGTVVVHPSDARTLRVQVRPESGAPMDLTFVRDNSLGASMEFRLASPNDAAALARAADDVFDHAVDPALSAGVPVRPASPSRHRDRRWADRRNGVGRPLHPPGQGAGAVGQRGRRRSLIPWTRGRPARTRRSPRSRSRARLRRSLASHGRLQRRRAAHVRRGGRTRDDPLRS